MLFNTLFTIPHAKKEEKKEQRMDLHDDIRAKSPIQFLTLLPTEFREGYCEIRISSNTLLPPTG